MAVAKKILSRPVIKSTSKPKIQNTTIETPQVSENLTEIHQGIECFVRVVFKIEEPPTVGIKKLLFKACSPNDPM